MNFISKTVIVTGAYGAIGKAIAANIAVKGYSVVLAGRDVQQLMKAADEIRNESGNTHIRFEKVDLSSDKSIREFRNRWSGPLHVLINNGCTAPKQRTQTPEGIEMQFATNVLGYFRMIMHFSPFMEGLDDARIVNVASYWAGSLDLDDLEFRERKYDNDQAYRQSKQADRMLTVAFAERLRKVHIHVNSCHPGDVNSKLSNSLGFGGSESPDQGAATPVWLATDPALKNITCKYFAGKSEAFCHFSQDHEAINRLFEICQEYQDHSIT